MDYQIKTMSQGSWKLKEMSFMHKVVFVLGMAAVWCSVMTALVILAQ